MLSYAIVQHVNWDLSPHRDAEMCARELLENVHIIQGATLCREVGEHFLRCAAFAVHTVSSNMHLQHVLTTRTAWFLQ